MCKACVNTSPNQHIVMQDALPYMHYTISAFSSTLHKDVVGKQH